MPERCGREWMWSSGLGFVFLKYVFFQKLLLFVFPRDDPSRAV